MKLIFGKHGALGLLNSIYLAALIASIWAGGLVPLIGVVTFLMACLAVIGVFIFDRAVDSNPAFYEKAYELYKIPYYIAVHRVYDAVIMVILVLLNYPFAITVYAIHWIFLEVLRLYIRYHYDTLPEAPNHVSGEAVTEDQLKRAKKEANEYKEFITTQFPDLNNLPK